MAKILVIEDDELVARTVVQSLMNDNHRVELATDGSDGLERLICSSYELAIVDWNLPAKTGLDLIKEYRSTGGDTPILMLTGNNLPSQKIQGLDCGADDYLSKPFCIDELRARVRALIRRSSSNRQCESLRVGVIELDPQKFTVSCRGKQVTLVAKEFQLLEFLMRHPGVVFSADALIQRVWSIDEEASADTIRTYIKNLRKKLDEEGSASIIENIRGIGYKLIALDS